MAENYLPSAIIVAQLHKLTGLRRFSDRLMRMGWHAQSVGSTSLRQRDAADWPVVFSDKFDRSDFGSAWSADPKNWWIQDGMAVGKLAPFTLSNGQTFQTAILTLKAVALPTTFALKLDVRVDQPLVASSILVNPRTKQSFQPLLSGRNDRGGCPPARRCS